MVAAPRESAGSGRRGDDELGDGMILKHDARRNDDHDHEQRHEHRGEVRDGLDAEHHEERDAQTRDDGPDRILEIAQEVREGNDVAHALAEHRVLNSEPTDHRDGHHAAEQGGSYLAEPGPAGQQAGREALTRGGGAERPTDHLQKHGAEHRREKRVEKRHAVAERGAEHQLRNTADGADPDKEDTPKRLLRILGTRCKE